jgi:hypothetical protein
VKGVALYLDVILFCLRYCWCRSEKSHVHLWDVILYSLGSRFLQNINLRGGALQKIVIILCSVVGTIILHSGVAHRNFCIAEGRKLIISCNWQYVRSKTTVRLYTADVSVISDTSVKVHCIIVDS